MKAQTNRITGGHRVVILLILFVAFGLRCNGLDAQELRGDEAFGYFFSLPALGEIVDQTVALREPHPVASYWLQHLWLGVAGHSEFGLRLVGVWWSVLAVALLVPMATHLALPTLAGRTAAALMALSPYAIWHAQDARMYSMSLALTMASMLLAVGWWKSKNGTGHLWKAFGYLLVTWLALQTHYFALYVVMAQHVALGGWAVVERSWHKVVVWWGIGLLLLLMWVPWLVTAWSILLDYKGNGDSPGLMDALVRAHSAFGVGETVLRAWQPWWATLTLAAVGLGVIALWQRPKQAGRSTLWLLMVYWLIPLVATWLSAQGRPIFHERYLVAAVPPVYLLMATAVGRQQGNDGGRWLLWLGRSTVALVIVGMVLGLARQVNDPLYSKTRGWRELSTALERLSAGIDPLRVRLVQNYPDPTLWYYYRGVVPHLVLPPAPLDQAWSNEEVARMVANDVGRVVLVEQPSGAWDPGSIARDALGAEYALAGTTNVAQWPLSIWLRSDVELEPILVEYVGGLQLTGARIVPVVVPPGGVLEVHLRWQGDLSNVGKDEAVSLQLLDNTGKLVTQSDRVLGMASLTTAEAASYAILVPKIATVGEYQLIVVVYDASRDGAPRRLSLAGTDHTFLGKITVSEP